MPLLSIQFPEIPFPSNQPIQLMVPPNPMHFHALPFYAFQPETYALQKFPGRCIFCKDISLNPVQLQFLKGNPDAF